MVFLLALVILCFQETVLNTRPAMAAQETLEQLVSAAKKEGEVTLIASASTFGGKKGFAELESGYNKRYGLTSKVNLAPGPSFPQVAARIMSEQQVRRLPVVTRAKRLIGIVALGDFAVDRSELVPAAEALSEISKHG